MLVGEIGNLFNLIFTYPIFNGLMLLYHLFGDFGLSIIVLTVIIKLVLFPLTLQQLKSMKATQALQPQMAEIRKKYAKDQQGQALAMQALYKEYGVNPVAGCLPLLIQLPVLYGLFYALNGVLRTSSVHEINSHLYPFVPHFVKFPNIYLNWFTFLNPAWHISLGAPDPTHILPILAGVVTFIQLRMSQPKTTSTTPANDPSTQSMKTMQYVMPLITVFFGWSFAAGLALYWTISSMFQAVQQYFVTGWGSLLVTPSFASPETGKSNGSTPAKSPRAADAKKSSQATKELQAKASQEAEDEVGEAGETGEAGEAGEADGEKERAGAVGSQMRSVPRSSGNSQSSRRRQRGGSASARRRSSTQRSRG